MQLLLIGATGASTFAMDEGADLVIGTAVDVDVGIGLQAESSDVTDCTGSAMGIAIVL